MRTSPSRAGVSVDRFAKPLRRCDCVLLQRDASDCGVPVLVTRRA